MKASARGPAEGTHVETHVDTHVDTHVARSRRTASRRSTIMARVRETISGASCTRALAARRVERGSARVRLASGRHLVQLREGEPQRLPPLAHVVSERDLFLEREHALVLLARLPRLLARRVRRLRRTLRLVVICVVGGRLEILQKVGLKR